MIELIRYDLNDDQRLDDIADYISEHSEYYPNAIDWFKNKYANTDSGCLLLLNDGVVIGLSLTKDETLFTSKISHLSVDEKYSGLGLGSRLLKSTLSYLSDSITITVKTPTAYSKTYFKMLRRRGFEVSSTDGGEVEFKLVRV